MNAHMPRTISRRHKALIFGVALLCCLCVVCGLAAGIASSSSAKDDGGVVSSAQSPSAVPNPTGEDIKKEFNDDDLKVREEKARGKWGAALESDMSQFNDSSVPVAVGGIQSLSGGGKYLGVVKIKRVGVINRSSRIINSVQLRWTVASLDDPQKILSEGATPFVNTWVEANSYKVIEIPTLYPGLMLKPLAKNGELYGRFQITIGMQEARFADGSFWRRQETVALYLDRRGGGV